LQLNRPYQGGKSGYTCDMSLWICSNSRRTYSVSSCRFYGPLHRDSVFVRGTSAVTASLFPNVVLSFDKTSNQTCIRTATHFSRNSEFCVIGSTSIRKNS